MLKSLRKHARYFYVLFVLVILSFVLWVPGMDRNDRSQRETLARIGDDVITQQEFWRSYDNAQELYRDVYKEKYDDAMQAQLKRDVLGGMIKGRILMIAAAESGVSVSDQELNDTIVSDPAFSREGVFSVEVYQNTLRLNRMNPAMYEAAKRRDLLLRKMTSVYENAVDLAPSELSGVSMDNELRAALGDALLDEKRQGAVLSFVNAYKKRLKLEVNEDLVL
ncbi:MAG: SurA N-terminal domain-containing protein [Thermodesulfovibrionales bacterium]|nr:SurA N-terminal domain-containing protein [Thermodesulfovibrionales bacterium]